ncbi:MAG: tetratricopeptide repeat protein [Phycisphaerales bacterium]|nr:MAG: tetratricopeptide repeat protein [Phycisphaerales bacterium]
MNSIMKGLVTCGTNVALLLVATGCSQWTNPSDQERAEQHWAEVRAQLKHQVAQNQFDSGAFEDAAKTIAEAIMLHPTQPDYYVLLAQSRLELGESAQALQVLKAAEALEVRSAGLAYTEGVLLERTEDLEQALDRYKEARNLDPDNIDYLVAQAECLAALGHVQAARDLVHEDLDEHAHDETLCMLAGHLAVALGDTKEAVEWFGRAMSSMPENNLVVEAYGLALVQEKRYAEAASVLRPLLARAGNDERLDLARRAVALCDLQLGRHEEALSTLRDYSGRHVDDVGAQILLAKAALAVGDTLTASLATDRATRTRPDHPEARFVRAVLLFKRGELQRAATLLENIINDNPRDAEALCILAEIRLADGENHEARALLQRAMRADPGCTWAKDRLNRISDASKTDSRKQLAQAAAERPG